jgi:hypothetical protein
MNELGPGVFHWKAKHPRIKTDVSSYYLADSGTLLDPMVPPEDGLDWFDERGPQRIVLTNRHHSREAERFVERFGIPVLSNERGLHEFEGKDLEVQGFAVGDEIAPGVTTHEFGAICPDDTALHIDAGPGFVAFADGIIRYGQLGFVPDNLMDEPEEVKRRSYEMARDLLELDFDGVLVAHGEPQASGGKAALRRLVEDGAAS